MALSRVIIHDPLMDARRPAGARLSRRGFLAGLSASATRAPAAPRFNVLLAAVDDLRPELGCYGNASVRSPNIDRLARRGVRFQRAYCQYPLCNPSRTSLLTGRYPTSTRTLDNNRHFRDQFPDWITLPQWFRHNGYVTARTGKIFHGVIDDAPSWDESGEPVRRRRPSRVRAPAAGAAGAAAAFACRSPVAPPRRWPVYHAGRHSRAIACAANHPLHPQRQAGPGPHR